MTKTSGVSFRGKNFWVYDVIGGVFLWHLTDAAKKYNFETRLIWLDDCIQKWQIAAAITELAFFADDTWKKDQIDLIIMLSRQAISEILAHGNFTDAEVRSLELIDELEIFPRGLEIIPCEPVARFGEAFISLLKDELPSPPDKTWWLYGLEEQPKTIEMRSYWDKIQE